jgi:integral membrane protein
MNSTLKRLHLIGTLEGISSLVLFFVAMPLKYMLDMPLAVKYTGWAHGLLFILYIGALLHAAFTFRWSLVKVALGFIASLVPFGPFVFDAKVVKKQAEKMKLQKVAA